MYSDFFEYAIVTKTNGISILTGSGSNMMKSGDYSSSCILFTLQNHTPKLSAMGPYLTTGLLLG